MPSGLLGKETQRWKEPQVPPTTKLKEERRLVGVWRVIGSTRLQNLAVRSILGFTCWLQLSRLSRGPSVAETLESSRSKLLGLMVGGMQEQCLVVRGLQ
eukprot:595909-Pelagomonas_calceolata.AAC.2